MRLGGSITVDLLKSNFQAHQDEFTRRTAVSAGAATDALDESVEPALERTDKGPYSVKRTGRGGHSREGGVEMNEVLRQEKKYLLNVVDGHRLSVRLGLVMAEDPHNGPLGYSIRSLYFDTIDNGDFWEKVDGVELRRKIRLRVYSPAADFAMLEMKQKQGAYQKKRSLRIEREDARRLCTGDYRPLLKYQEPFAAECYSLMRRRCYLPKTVVEYRRKAFIAKENHIRITLDSQITATEASWDLFAPDLPQYTVLDPFNLVLEVKYNGFLLSYIKDLAGAADRSEFSQSKYCLARSVGMRGSG